MRRTVENIKDPLYRYFEREVNSGAKLLQDVIHDLEDVVLICQVSKQTDVNKIVFISIVTRNTLPACGKRSEAPLMTFTHANLT